MIKVDKIETFLPFGREFCREHPSAGNEIGNETNEQKEQWSVLYSDAHNQLETYVCKKTAVISKKSLKGANQLLKTYTVTTPILGCVTCKFKLPTENDNQDPVLQGTCLLESRCINVFTDGGEVHMSTLPFPVSQMWALASGLLLERTVTPAEMRSHKRDIPTMFTILHPLDEPRPVTSRTKEKISYICDPTLNVVFTSDNPPLVMMYDSVIGLHSLWVVSQAKQEDYPDSPATGDSFPELHISGIAHQPTPLLHSGTLSRLSVATPTHSHSPYRTFTPSPAGRSLAQSPAPIRVMSPAVGHLSNMRTFSPTVESPAFSSIRSPSVFRSPISSLTKEDSFWENSESLCPEVCLTHVWQETLTSVRHGAKGKASKVFVMKNIYGEQFLCYLIKHLDRLRGLNFTVQGSVTHFDTTFEIMAKDASPVMALGMMLVLELDRNVSLFNGFKRICAINLRSVDRCLLPHSFDEVDRFSLNTTSEQQINQTNTKDAGKDEQLQGKFDCPISSFRDPMPMGCNMVLQDGSIHKVFLPSLPECSLVTRCLEVLKLVLPKDTAMQIIAEHYTKWNTASSHDALDTTKSSTIVESEIELFSEVMLKIAGYPEEISDLKEASAPIFPVAKKSRTHVDRYNNTEWHRLTESKYHEAWQDKCFWLHGVEQEKTANERRTAQAPVKVDSSSVLFQNLPTVLFAWHLVYEELKLNKFTINQLFGLGNLLYRLSRDLGWKSYEDHYLRDFPSLTNYSIPLVDNEQFEGLFKPSYVSDFPPSINQWILSSLQGKQKSAFPLISGVCKQTFFVVMLYSVILPMENGTFDYDPTKIFKVIPQWSNLGSFHLKKHLEDILLKLESCKSAAEKVVIFMAETEFKRNDLECLPYGVAQPLKESIQECFANPPPHLTEDAYRLIGREDLAAQVNLKTKDAVPYFSTLNKAISEENGGVNDGMDFSDEVMKLRFGKDLRVEEVRRLLQSAKPVRVSVLQKPEVSDHDFIQEQETRLLTLCKRTMALPVGRGMFSLATSHPVLTETLPIPPLELTGRAPPRNTVVDLNHIDTPSDMKVWPSFHNGVASGLRIAPDTTQIDSTWIVYNKPIDGQLTNEHAGFLMALGLSGHLKNLSYMILHDYLCKGHELTTVGLLLGIGAAKRGTMDIAATKMLSIHVDALLPPTSAELDLPHSAQVAALLGVGLLYQGTGHRRMAEVLLSEIGRPPGPEMDNATNRESYSLSAGLALGLVMLEHGNEVSSVLDLKLADHLYHYMIGGQKKPQIGTQKEKFKSPSYQIKEGDSVNIDITAPGATLALGLMFMKTNNKSVASWLVAPDTQFLLDFVRPDFLLLRLLSRGLIVWDMIAPTVDWVEEHVPPIVQKYAFCSDNEAAAVEDSEIDLQTLSQAKANIVAGCCMAMGLRFAGSANEEAFLCLMHFTKYFKNLLSTSAVEQAGKPTVETCLNATLLSLSLVMAGTGNLDVLRIARQLHKRTTLDVHYGNHMAVHMAIGFLFLGGGRYTLSSSSSAVAALVCALYPRFPLTSSDNRYHLQAFRHLYVLAAEPRVIVTREVDSWDACYVPLLVTLKAGNFHPETTLKLTTPCIIPEFDTIKKIRTDGPRYLPVTIVFEDNSTNASALMSKLGTIFVKRRAGHLSYVDDPKGYRNLLARTFNSQTDKTEVISSFSSDPQMIALTQLFCNDIGTIASSEEEEEKSFIAAILFECVTEEKPEVIKVYMQLKRDISKFEHTPDIRTLWNIKFILSYYLQAYPRIVAKGRRVKPLLNGEFIAQCKDRVDACLERLMETTSYLLREYLETLSCDMPRSDALSCLLIHFEIPFERMKKENLAQGSMIRPFLFQHTGPSQFHY